MCIFFPDLTPVCGCPDCQVCVDRELPLPLPAPQGTGSGFPSARAERWRELLDTSRRIDVALEAPLFGRPALRSA